MLRTSESETEILLGNKQLLGIFLVVALLLAVSFYGGYMVGQGAAGRRVPVSSSAQQDTASGNSSAGGGETHVLPAVSGTSAEPNATADEGGAQGRNAAERSKQADGAPLGAPKRRVPTRTEPSEAQAGGPSTAEAFAPQVGQQFLQVAAVSRDEAEALADVLHKKGFRAHAVPKPGNAKIYRVIIGPIRDTADLSSTRDSLMRTGFREVIPQRY
ncbi:MAG: SPOR domain-containing protein [Acidobacteriota bacterium]|nr:SPOR domain-containing protein [Acidobacteriota bacterium]